MAFDPHREDYQRMALRFVRTLDGQEADDALRAFAHFGRLYNQESDLLPQSDEERSFHLMADAAHLIDYELPFADDADAEGIVSRAHTLLEEALSLDPANADARRMRQAALIVGFEPFYAFLLEGQEQVRLQCEERRERALCEGNHERSSFGAFLALAPYLRWLASLASKALICGHNHAAVDACERLLALDPSDAADARFTQALALAKLEDATGLDELERRVGAMDLDRPRRPQDAWLQLSRCALAYKQDDLARARSWLHGVCEGYPQARATLYLQKELPDGVFARLALPPLSEDELIVAVSEATVLLQEGRDRRGRGSFGAWVMDEVAKELSPRERRELDELRDAQVQDGRGEGGSAPSKEGSA
ncbi:hypothetical protein [Olsenella sp. HMSC062G07]|uniref:hypothetical protein n=1 Tax=Olsenella sp. HMSC062G07 TaxID=1739330 RepID=UPI0008A4F5E3|nr:hypothetical protein [Olsenella sp. HMSC062G07]OFK22147.1 hypothetical protein HMPREF2826_02715 [Olsenella sp. HMSC062G07]